jgi:hypothetical protein
MRVPLCRRQVDYLLHARVSASQSGGVPQQKADTAGWAARDDSAVGPRSVLHLARPVLYLAVIRTCGCRNAFGAADENSATPFCHGLCLGRRSWRRSRYTLLGNTRLYAVMAGGLFLIIAAVLTARAPFRSAGVSARTWASLRTVLNRSSCAASRPAAANALTVFLSSRPGNCSDFPGVSRKVNAAWRQAL